MTPVDPKELEGVAAVGTMPAATGKPASLFALRYIDLKLGTGDLAETRKYYTVHYTGWLPDGTKFDSSVDRGQPFMFLAGARRVILAWDTGFEGMRVGGKRRLIVPYQLGYGEAGQPPVIPAKSDLIFDVELLGQSDTPTPPAATTAPRPSSDVAATTKEKPEEHQE